MRGLAFVHPSRVKKRDRKSQEILLYMYSMIWSRYATRHNLLIASSAPGIDIETRLCQVRKFVIYPGIDIRYMVSEAKNELVVR